MPYRGAALLWALAFCAPFASAVDWDAELRLRADYLPDAPGDGGEARVLARLGLRGNWLGAAGRIGVSAQQNSTPWQNGGLVELRDAYLTWAGDWGSLRLGQQQIAWGRADAFRLLDKVNPWRFPDAFYDDLADARVPTWMANLELPLGGFDVQILAGADQRLDSLDPGYPNPNPLGSSQPRLSSPEPLGGARIGTLLGDLSVSLHWLDHPNLYPLWQVSPEGNPTLFESRQTMYGLSADLPIGGLVARMEATTSLGKTLNGSLLPVEQRFDQFLLGADVQVGNWMISPQLYYEQRDPPEYASGKSVRRFGSLLVSHRMMQDQLAMQVFGAFEFDGQEQWVSLRVGYTVNDHLELQLHADYFDSYPEGLFGPFSDLSRVGVATVLRY